MGRGVGFLFLMFCVSKTYPKEEIWPGWVENSGEMARTVFDQWGQCSLFNHNPWLW